jgi:hypothetical protein
LEEKTTSRKIDPARIIVIILLFALISYVVVQNKRLTNNSVYTKGVIINIDQGVRGNVQLNFYFFVNGKQHKSFVAAIFCNQCKTPCCSPGDSVIVRYEKDNPNNNQLLHQLPKDAILTY